MTTSPNDVTRTMLAVSFTGGLIALSFLVIGRFAPSIVWAATLVLPSWPLMRRLKRSLVGRRWAAVTIPLSIAISSIASHAPVLLALSADLPLLLILVGAIGGLLAFGMIGLFVGPVILAVTHTLLQHRMARPAAGRPQ